MCDEGRKNKQVCEISFKKLVSPVTRQLSAWYDFWIELQKSCRNQKSTVSKKTSTFEEIGAKKSKNTLWFSNCIIARRSSTSYCNWKNFFWDAPSCRFPRRTRKWPSKAGTVTVYITFMIILLLWWSSRRLQSSWPWRPKGRACMLESRLLEDHEDDELFTVVKKTKVEKARRSWWWLWDGLRRSTLSFGYVLLCGACQ